MLWRKSKGGKEIESGQGRLLGGGGISEALKEIRQGAL